MTKQRNIQYFTAKFNGKEITFRCYTTWTRNGFCHTAESYSWDMELHTTPTKQSYINRTWERFDYETVLNKAIEKLPKDMRETVRDQVIHGKAAEECAKAEAFVQAFTSLHEKLSPENKERLANSGLEINTQGDAQAVMGLMGLMALTQK